MKKIIAFVLLAGIVIGVGYSEVKNAEQQFPTYPVSSGTTVAEQQFPTIITTTN